MSRMFLIDGKPMDTWNCFKGCRFDCSYCNARKAALTRFKHIPRYRDGFTPGLVSSEMSRRFKPGQFIFVAYMGDIYWASRRVVELILGIIRDFPETNFLFCTKNPFCYEKWGFEYPDNLYLGTTIESDINYLLSKAPPASVRYWIMARLPHPNKFVSIEPIMDFDLATMILWLSLLKPKIIEVGADNYRNNLPEPPGWKVRALLAGLRSVCPVVEKKGLERLTNNLDWGQTNIHTVRAFKQGESL